MPDGCADAMLIDATLSSCIDLSLGAKSMNVVRTVDGD